MSSHSKSNFRYLTLQVKAPYTFFWYNIMEKKKISRWSSSSYLHEWEQKTDSTNWNTQALFFFSFACLAHSCSRFNASFSLVHIFSILLYAVAAADRLYFFKSSIRYLREWVRWQHKKEGERERKTKKFESNDLKWVENIQRIFLLIFLSLFLIFHILLGFQFCVRRCPHEKRYMWWGWLTTLSFLSIIFTFFLSLANYFLHYRIKKVKLK